VASPCCRSCRWPLSSISEPWPPGARAPRALTKRAFDEVNRRAVSKGDAGSATSLFAEAFNAGSAEIDAGTTNCAAGKKALEDVDRLLPR
jgi:hypothetical protein